MRPEINTSGKKRFFTVPCFLVDEYIKLADGDSLKVILYLLSDDSDEYSVEIMCSKLGMTKTAAEDALLFWKQLGVIAESNMTEDAMPKAEPIISKPVAPQPAETIKQISHRGYTPKEIADMIETDEGMRELFYEAERTLGRVLKHSDHEMLISLRNYYGFAPQSVVLLLEYCHDLGKTSTRYIETVARDFFDNEVTDFLDIDLEIRRRKEQRSFESLVSNDFGLETKLTPKQAAYIDSWRDMGFSVDMISAARIRCVDATNKLQFPYINKILETWAEKKIFTLEAIETDVKPQAKTESFERSFDLEEFDNYTLGLTNGK